MRAFHIVCLPLLLIKNRYNNCKKISYSYEVSQLVKNFLEVHLKQSLSFYFTLHGNFYYVYVAPFNLQQYQVKKIGESKTKNFVR